MDKAVKYRRTHLSAEFEDERVFKLTDGRIVCGTVWARYNGPDSSVGCRGYFYDFIYELKFWDEKTDTLSADFVSMDDLAEDWDRLEDAAVELLSRECAA